MKLERDKFLTEAMDECWLSEEELTFCSSCGQEWRCNTDFTTWEGFGKLWEWAQPQKWWGNFKAWSKGVEAVSMPINEQLIHPDNFAEAVYKFLKEK